MITGFSQGRLLALLSQIIQPQRILEIGTFTGYGALCLAEGLAPEGVLYTLERSEENAWLARKYFQLSPYSTRIKLMLGSALDLLPQLDETWDLVYVDADKPNNLNYVKATWPKLRSGGLVLIDNVFAHGAVLEEKEKMSALGKSLLEFNNGLAGHFPDGKVTIVPIRDGLTVLKKD